MTETNDCEYAPLLSLLHDGELPPERARAVTEHVRTCPACAAELAALRRMSGVFSSAAFPPAPPSLKRLKPRAGRPRRWGMRMGPQPPPADENDAPVEPYREPRHLRVIRVLTAVAAVVFLIAVGGLVLQQLRQRSVKQAPGGAPWERVEHPQRVSPGTAPADLEPSGSDE